MERTGTKNRTIRVCQNTTCRKQGAAKVLSAFEQQAPDEVVVEASGCLGHCGSGPSVLILPDNEWCLHVQPKSVPVLVKRHCEVVSSAVVNSAVVNSSATSDEDMQDAVLSGALSDANKVFRRWLMVIGGMMGAIALATWLISKNSHYM